MSLNPDIRDQAYQFFIEEAQELLQVMETGLLELRQDHSISKVHELMRAAHSIKGGAASVELSAIGLLAHRLEDFFKALYSDEVDFDQELESLLLQGYDCLSHPLLEQVAVGSFDEEAALLNAEPVFAALEIRLAEALKNADSYIPSSNDLGVDIVASIFEVDVVQAIAHLQTVMLQPGDYDLAAELAGTLEMFAGFGELFNLSGFSNIIQTAQAALESNPQNALAIIKITVADCTLAAEQILAGDREQGGTVSQALVELAQGNLVEAGSPEFAAHDSSTNDAISQMFDQLGEDISNDEVEIPEAFSTFSTPIDQTTDDVFAFGSTPVDTDHLWADIPDYQSSVEDIFGTLPENASFDKDIPSTSDDDAFNQMFDSVDEDIQNLTDDKDDEVVTTPETIDQKVDIIAADILAIAEGEGRSIAEIPTDQDNLWSAIPADELSIEDIFGAIPSDYSAIAMELESETASDTASEDSLAIAEGEGRSIAEIPTDQDNLWSAIPADELSIEDIFSSIPSDYSAMAMELESETPEAKMFDLLGDDPLVDQSITEPEAELINLEINPTINNTTDDSLEQACTETSPELSPTVEQKINQEVDQSVQLPITAAVESISNIFENLPQAQKDFLLPIVSAPTQPKPKLTAKNTANKNTTAKLSVRVDLDRLERMNNLVGELTINRNSLALQNEQLQENVAELEQKFWRLRGVTRQLREISDQILLEGRLDFPKGKGVASRPASAHALPSRDLFSSSVPERQIPGNNLAEAEFDILELDSYSLLHASLQEVLEEMMQLEESVEDITIFAQQSDRTIDSQRQMLGQIRDELMWVRMLPLDHILQRFPRTLRDLASKYHKPVELKLQGTGVLVDKAVLEKLADPLLHLLRNGFDHGIENPQTRAQQGKSTTGLIEIQAYYQGNQTVIEVKDDGQGLDLQKIAQKGIERGLISAEQAASASPERLFELIFEPGFSTASQVSEISGRGVGMNIVRSQVETLKGKISVTSMPGKGSTFTLRLPLTLTIAKLLVCSLGSTNFALPADSIEEIIIPTAEQIKLANGQQFLSLKGKLIPIYVLSKVLAYNCPIPDTDSNSKAFQTIAPPEDWAAPLLLLRRGQQLFALEVARLLSEQELVIKPFGKGIAAPNYSYGCAILSDGSLIPAFDGAALIGMILGEEPSLMTMGNYSPEVGLTAESSESDLIEQEMTKEGATTKSLTALKTIMIVDDSTALRRTMALTLEKEGYRVIQKKDGKEALDGFKQHPQLDLIICDVEMPVMNGFEFLGMRRRDSALAKVPTFMLTSRSGEKHRNLAKQLGADGYFTKPYVEQDFIQDIKKFLDSQSQTLPPQNHIPQPIQGAIATKTKIKTKTILIIDDSSALRRTLALSLEQKGYRVLQGRDGTEGLEQLRHNQHTDLVICDIEMPNLNGFEFLTLRRQETQLSKIPVVMLTSRGSEKHRALASSLGAVGFFTKPYVEDKFISEIEQYIC
jgi:two-component system, chemotaxis family, sensor histidine kinase and response regulator PixL